MKQSTRIKITSWMVMAAIVFCFTGMAAAQGTTKINVCSLLTKAEIQAAIGQNVSERKPKPNANPAMQASCNYVIGTYGVFSILVKETGPGETANKLIEEFKKMKIPVSDAAGLGDRRFFPVQATEWSNSTPSKAPIT